MRITWAGKGYTPSSLAVGGEYDPRIPLVSVEKDRTQDDIVWNDVPRQLEQRLQAGMSKIELDCIAENAEAVLTFYENDILEHVVGQEANSKQLRKLLARDAVAEKIDPAEFKAQIGAKLAKSSYLGKDPFGDKPLPEELYEDAEDSSSEEGTPSETEGEEAPAKLLSSEGDLLRTIQDKAHRYARVHLRRIVGEEIWARVAAKEQEIGLHPEKLSAHNGRLPWKEYRAMVLEDLRKATGLHELMLILSLVRETGDTAHKWVRRLEVGRSILQSRMGTNLSDAIYVKLAARQLTRMEITDMARAMMARAASNAEQLTHARAVARIEDISWEEFTALVENAVAPQRKYKKGDVKVPPKERVVIYAQTMAQDESRRKRVKIERKAKEKHKTGKNGKEWIECAKCKAAGITKPSHLKHLTKDCDPEIQAKRLQALGKPPGQGGRGQNKGQPKEAGTGKGCNRCREAGRPHRSHHDAICFYRPGGKYDQSEEAKKARRDRYQDQKRRSRACQRGSGARKRKPSTARSDNSDSSVASSDDCNPWIAPSRRRSRRTERPGESRLDGQQGPISEAEAEDRQDPGGAPHLVPLEVRMEGPERRRYSVASTETLRGWWQQVTSELELKTHLYALYQQEEQGRKPIHPDKTPIQLGWAGRGTIKLGIHRKRVRDRRRKPLNSKRGRSPARNTNIRMRGVGNEAGLQENTLEVDGPSDKPVELLRRRLQRGWTAAAAHLETQGGTKGGIADSDTPKSLEMGKKGELTAFLWRTPAQCSKRRQAKPRHSETDELQLVKVYLDLEMPDGQVKQALAAIDTQSNVTFVNKAASAPRPWKNGESRVVHGFNGQAVVTQPRWVTILKNGARHRLEAREEPNGDFPDGVEVLLSARACRKLKIDVNYAMANLKHQRVRYLEDRRKTRTERRELRRKARKTWATVRKRSCRLAERLMAEYLASVDNVEGAVRREISLDDVKMGEDLSPEDRRQCRAILEKYKDGFTASPDDVPPPLKDVEPVRWCLKEGAKPARCKKPNWGPAQKKFLTAWTKQALDQGLVEPAKRSSWASRPVLVGKYRGDTPKGAVPDDIRVCIDYIAVNERIKKTVDYYPDPQELLRRAGGHEFYFCADAQKQFWTIPLAEGLTREMTAFWTPQGLMQYTRLVMGAKNASSIAQKIFDDKMQALPASSASNIVNFQDDFLGFADTVADLLRHLEAFLLACRQGGIHMNPAKMYVGIRKAKFYGFDLSKRGLSPTISNLDPVQKMQQPRNRSEVRSVLGVFNQFRAFFERYDRLMKPLQQLLRKDVAFKWTEECEAGFQHVREKLLSGRLYLAAPRKDLPLILETDGSDDGWGAILLQEVDGERKVIQMWSKQWKTVQMRKSPPYYKECAAFMRGLELARIYADAHPLPVRCITDHIPLTWVKHTSGKGPVSQFVLDNLGKLEYTIEYRRGEELVQADAVSRFPCLGPRTLAPEGLVEAVKVLLRAMPADWDVPGRLWTHAGKETKPVRDLVCTYQDLLPRKQARRVPATDRPSDKRIQQQKYGLAIFAPPADKVVEVLRAVLVKGKPFACLTPISLVNQAPPDEQVSVKLRKTTKIVLLDPELTWVIHGVPGLDRHQVHARHVHTFGPEPDLVGILTGPPEFDTAGWAPAQKKLIDDRGNKYSAKNTVRSQGLWYHKQGDTEIRLIVPEEHQQELAAWQHKALLHASAPKVEKALRKRFHWPDLSKDSKEAAAGCSTCAILNARRNAAHKHFRSKVYSGPRTVWSMDYYGVYPSKEGFKHILGAVDAATCEVRLFATKDRSAAITTDCILQGIVLRDGCPLILHTDHAKEFVSKAVRRLRRAIGMQQTTTLGHHPTGNAQIERIWQFVTKALRMMTREQHQHWQNYVRLMEHTWNTTTKAATGSSPFELAHGLAARSVVDSLAPGPEYSQPSSMDAEGIKALGTTARAFEELARQAQLRARSDHADKANNKGGPARLAVGDKVSFYIPPSAEEAKRAGRKMKHLPHFRGPAEIIGVLSSSTYELEHHGRHYKRSIQELRKYRAEDPPRELPMANEWASQEAELRKGSFIAFCETDDPDDIKFHVAEVVQVNHDEQMAKVRQFVTKAANINKAKWSPLHIWTRRDPANSSKWVHTYQMGGRPDAKFKPVLEEVPLLDPAEEFNYIRHNSLKMLKSGKLAAKSCQQLTDLGLQHHRLGITYQ